MSDEKIVEVMARALNDHNEDQWADPCKEWAASALSALRDAGFAVVKAETLQSCADELAAELDARYKRNGTVHPAEQRRYDRDMSTVVEARAILKGN